MRLSVRTGALTLCALSSLFSQPSSPAPAPEPSPFVFQWPRETALLVTGLGAQRLGDYRVKHLRAAGPADLRRADLSPLDRWNAGAYNPPADLASDLLTVSVGGSMVLADAWHASREQTSWRPFLEDFLILGEAFAWSSALNLNIRAERVHPRPFVYGTKAPASERAEGQAAGSFYSGHASEAFLGAVYLASVYPLRHPEFEQRGWLWAGSLTAAATASALRVAAGKHFPSDVIAGAAMGTLLGLGFVQLHRPEGASLWGWSPQPWLTPGGAPGLLAVKTF